VISATSVDEGGYLHSEKTTHLVVTSIWAAGFTATAVVLGVVEYAAPHSGVIEILVQVAGNFVPAVLAYRYLAGRRDGVAVMR
jgi:hypothetical protein